MSYFPRLLRLGKPKQKREWFRSGESRYVVVQAGPVYARLGLTHEECDVLSTDTRWVACEWSRPTCHCPGDAPIRWRAPIVKNPNGVFKVGEVVECDIAEHFLVHDQDDA